MQTPRRHLLLALYGVFVLTVVPTYFSSYPLPDFFPKLKALLAALYLSSACWAVGDCFFTQRNKKTVPVVPLGLAGFIEQKVASLWLGFGLLGSIVLLLGWALPGELTTKLRVLNIGLLCLLVWRLRQGFGRGDVAPTVFSWGQIGLLGITLGALLMVLLSCFSPITYYDSLVYHLALPAMYNQAQAINAVPSNLYSYFPANVEMIFLFILNQFPEPEYVINLWGWAASFSLALGIAAWAYEFGGQRQAILSFFLWWTMPAVLFLSMGAYVDLPLAGFIYLSVQFFYRASKENWNSGMLVLAGTFSGFAVATKYTGAICPIFLGTYLLYASVLKRRLLVREMFLLAVPALFPAGLWFIKNGVTVGNPFFPFFYQVFGAPDGWSTANAAGYFSQLTEYGTKSNLLFELVRAPWSLTGSAIKYGGGFDVLGDFGWPLILFAAPLAFFLSPKKSPVRFLSAYALVHFLIWFGTKPVFRFLVGLLPVAILLASFSIDQLLREKKRLVQIVVVLVLVPWLISNFFMYFFIAQGLRPFSVALGFDSYRDYCARRLPYFQTFDFANNTLGASDKVLLIGEQRTYHLRRPFMASNLFAESPIARISSHAKSIWEIDVFCRSNEITHLILNEGEIERLGGMSKFGFTDNGVFQINQFISKKTEVIFEKHRVKLMRIIP